MLVTLRILEVGVVEVEDVLDLRFSELLVEGVLPFKRPLVLAGVWLGVRSTWAFLTEGLRLWL